MQRSGMFLEGSHLSLFILTPTAGQGDHDLQVCKFFTHCLKSYLKAHHSCQSGLTSSYVAVIAENSLKEAEQSPENAGYGEWHRVPPPPSTHVTPSHPLLSTDHISCTTVLDNVLRLLQLQGQSGCHSNDNGLDNVSSMIHSLLDSLPPAVHRDDSYYVMDVYWLVPKLHQLSLPDSEVDFFGALLRLQKWNHAHIHMITLPAQDLLTSPAVCAWREGVGSLSVSSVREWEPPSGLVWRGAVHCSEHKVFKQAIHKTLSFPGFSLKLLPLEATPISSQTIPSLNETLEGVGLKTDSHFNPSHLEVLQVVDMATFPLFWLSPLQCNIVLADTQFNSSSHLFESLSSAKENVGVVMCLCTQSHDYQLLKFKPLRHKEEAEPVTSQTSLSGCPIRNKTTAEWVEFIRGLEGESLTQEFEADVPAPLLAYATGPRLLVTPTPSSTNNGTVSYDAWFLWRPEMINTEIVSQKSLQSSEIADDEDCDGSSLFSDASACELLKELQERVTSIASSTELNTSPSAWQEMKALKTYEWIQRKMTRRIATPDLMFGHMVAPPPRDVTSQLESLGIADVLNSFTDRGTPATSRLSPITMTGRSRLVKVHTPDPDLSYQTIIASTPSSRRVYHGVNYCLTDDDTSTDAKLTRIQQRYLFSERASHCNSVVTPKAERAKQQARRLRGETVSLSTPKEQSTEGGSKPVSKDPEQAPVKRTPQKTKRHYPQNRVGLSLTKSPVINLSKVSSKKLARVKQLPPPARPSAPLTKKEKELNREPLPPLPPSKEEQKSKEVIPVGESDMKDENALMAAVRRSPRKKKWTVKTKNEKEEKKESLKSKLGVQVVNALKKRDMPRSHPCFRKCYARLFKVSKSFLLDLGGAAAQLEEIKRVVELNAKNVVEFELDRQQKTVTQ